MNILKEKKYLILGIIIDIIICVFAVAILYLYLDKTSVVASSPSNLPTSNKVSNVLIAVLNTNQSSKEDVTEIVTNEKASDKELKEEKVTKKEVNKSTSPYYIKVNYKANVVTIYTKDKNGKYTVPYKAMVCSTGTYTPRSGTYKISSKYRWGKLIHNVYGQYATRIVGSILFHSVPYSSNSADTLLYKEYDKLGTTASAGCVRLTVKDAKWIYANCPSGTMVEFYSSSNPGPLGKPTAQKISSVEECRNWDPTDPASTNPWYTYTPEEEKPSEDISNNNSNTVTNSISNNIINESTNNSVLDNNTVNNSVINNTITNNTIIDTNSTANNISNSVNSNNIINESTNNSVIDNNTVSNSIIDNTTTNNTINNSNNNVIENNVQNNNSNTENNIVSNNIVDQNNNITNNLIINNNTVLNANNVIINNSI